MVTTTWKQRVDVHVRRFCNASLIVMLGLFVLSCQTPTEPDDIVVGDGFPVEAFVTDQGGQAIANARVQWTFVQRGTAEPVMLSSFTTDAAHNALTASNGQASFVIPVPVTKDGLQVLFKVTAPAGDPNFAGRQQFGDFGIDTALVCDTTVLRFQLRKEVSVTCGSAPPCTDVEMFIEPPLTTLDTAEQGDFVVPGNAVVLRSVTTTPALPAEIRFEVIVNNVVVGMPASVPAGTPFKVRFIGGPATTARQIDDSYTVNLVTENAAGQPCWSCSFNLRYRVVPTTPCDCPATIRDTVPNKPDTLCVGDSKDSTFALNIANPNQDCDLIYELDMDSLTEPFNEVSLTGIGTSGGTSVSIPPGGTLSEIGIHFEPLARRAYLQRFYFRVSRNTPTGVVPCSDPLLVYYRGQGGLPICVIDSAASTIFRRVGANFRVDTLRNCVGIVDSIATKTLVFRNDGECPIASIDLSANNTQFSASPGSISLKGGERKTVSLRFKPTQADVYPGGRCTTPQYVQNTTLDITGCSMSNMPLVGRASTEQECANKQPLITFKYDTTDFASARWRTVIDILSDNRLVITDNKRTTLDSVAVYVQSFNVTGLAPGGTVNSAVLGSGPDPSGGCWVEYAKVANMPILNDDICNVFQTVGCPTPSTFSCSTTVVPGDVLIFKRDSYYGIMWISKLDFATSDPRSLPQLIAQVCYPFN